MVCKEGVVIWFRGLQGDERIDLMCSLLDCCVPLELRFLGTYIEFAASKHYSNLQKYEKTVNESSFGELRDLYDARIRRKFLIYLALLYSYNKKAATDMFKYLEDFELPSEKQNSKNDNLSLNGEAGSDEETCLDEIKLLLSMASYHPAFTFHQKQTIRNKLDFPQKPTQSTSTIQQKEAPTESIRKSPQVCSNLNELVYVRTDISNISLSSGITSGTRLQSPLDNRLPTRYQAVPFAPLFSQAPAIPTTPFQSIPVCNIGSMHAIPGPITVYPTNPHTQVPPTLQPMLVKPSSVGKSGGLAQGPNGVIHTIYPAPVFAANPSPTSSSVVTCTPSEYRFASAPIPVRPTRMYGPVNQPSFNPAQQHQQQQKFFSFGMSPYQSPMDSPLTSPFTSPSPSPKSSPLPSPRLSPFPSPVESPMFRKKFGSDRLSGRRNSDQFASVYDWLRSLRLHKYSETFKDYTFDQMKDLKDDDLAKLGLTQGARKKFRLNINALLEKGFRGFGLHSNSLPDPARPGQAGNQLDTPPRRKTSSASDSKPVSGSASGELRRQSSTGAATEAKTASQKAEDASAMKDKDCSGKSATAGESDDGSQDTSESLEDFLSDDEVFMTRRPTVIENKDCQFPIVSCYNCGSKDHFGEQCMKQTMEGETYQRYGYRLKYDGERLKDER